MSAAKPSQIQFRCPECDSQLGVAGRKAGAEVHCPACDQLVHVPTPSEPAANSTGQDEADRPGRTEHRPLWVYLVFLVYLLLVAGVTLGPLVLALLIGERDWGPLVAGLVYAVLLSSCSVSLLVIPISRSRVLPDRRRPLWVPLIYSATLAATVFFGLAIASHEFAGPLGGRKDSPGFGITAWAIFGGTPVVWVAWLIIFNDPREG